MIRWGSLLAVLWLCTWFTVTHGLSIAATRKAGATARLYRRGAPSGAVPSVPQASPSSKSLFSPSGPGSSSSLPPSSSASSSPPPRSGSATASPPAQSGGHSEQGEESEEGINEGKIEDMITQVIMQIGRGQPVVLGNEGDGKKNDIIMDNKNLMHKRDATDDDLATVAALAAEGNVAVPESSSKLQPDPATLDPNTADGKLPSTPSGSSASQKLMGSVSAAIQQAARPRGATSTPPSNPKPSVASRLPPAWNAAAPSGAELSESAEYSESSF